MCFLLYFIGYNHYGFWCVFLLYFIGYNHYGFWCVFYFISLVITTMASDVFFTLFHWL
jgi:hypothetical protein